MQNYSPFFDPDKVVLEIYRRSNFKINQSPASHILLAEVTTIIDQLVVLSKTLIYQSFYSGNPSQISDEADAILFLSLISGRNPDYLIEHQVNAVPILKQTDLEIISTGYILIESGTETAVERIVKPSL
jgi:putative glycerol-1-phosphate prenyltransferase